jgi:cellulose synthase/poly-beta-1,6-N-acetylglucosamine synthase-like glycosyltransferase
MAVIVHPAIPACAADVPRPFWSVMIPTRDPHRGYLEETLRSVLDQDPGADSMQIAVIDDCSQLSDPAECVRETGRGRIAFLRQPAHRGMADNWNTCIRHAAGQWVHILHQDDVVRPGFYARLRTGIESAPLAGAAFCRDAVIDGDGLPKWPQPVIRTAAGIIDDWLEHIFVSLHLRASALVVKRTVYETLGGFSPDLRYALDWDMWKRIAAAYPMWYEPEVLAFYRRHDGCASAAFARSGRNIAEIRRSIELSASSLDPAIGADVSRRARANYTRYAAVTAWRAFMDRDLVSGFSQLREARKLTSTSAVIAAVAQVIRRARRIPL